jgi:uncharacterized protein
MSHRCSMLFVFLATLALSTLVVHGCSTGPPVRLYILTSLSRAESMPPATGEREISIGVGPVELPQYVNRPQMVTGQQSSELQSAASAQWAEPLQDGFTRVLAQNLSLLLATDRVALFPWKTFAPEYQVVVEVTHFLGQTEGEVSLVALWSILTKDGREVLVSKKSSVREATGSPEYEALAAAMSRTVAALSRDIATALLALPQLRGKHDVESMDPGANPREHHDSRLP